MFCLGSDNIDQRRVEFNVTNIHHNYPGKFHDIALPKKIVNLLSFDFTRFSLIEGTVA